VAFECDGFQSSLHVINGSLGRAAAFRRIRPGKSPTENNTGGLRRNRNVLAKVPPGHLKHGRLTAARSSGEHDQLRRVPDFLTPAGMGAGWKKMVYHFLQPSAKHNQVRKSSRNPQAADNT
jgi:hypothetical protein